MPCKPQGAFGKNIASMQMWDILTPKEAYKNISLAEPRMCQANCDCKNCGGDEIEVHALFLSQKKTPQLGRLMARRLLSQPSEAAVSTFM
jgi:hypothetical protein